MVRLLLLILVGVTTLLSNKVPRLSYSVMNINDWKYWQSIRWPTVDYVPYFKLHGGIFPQNGVQTIYIDGLIWAGWVRDHDPNTPDLRAGGSYYNDGVQLGWIEQSGDGNSPPVAISPENPRVGFYRIRPDYANLSDESLKKDAADLFSMPLDSVKQVHIDQIRAMYEKDWKEWPGDLGAPYYDLNNNGQWDPDFDQPGIANADMVIWYVTNDLHTFLTNTYFDSPPIGLELQVTIWAYDRTWVSFPQTIYKRYRLINKSGFVIDSMYIGQFLDTDIEDYADDFVGCDTTLNLGYGYNGDDQLVPYFGGFLLAPPAVGYALLQGPIIRSKGDTARVDFGYLPDYRNLKMTSFFYGNPSSAIDPFPERNLTNVFYNILRGYTPTSDITNPTPFITGSGPDSGKVTKFPLCGDPVSGEGDIDGKGNNFGPGDRRLVVCSGPFTMQPGQTQEIVFALIGAEGDASNSNTAAVAQLRQYTKMVHEVYKDIEDIPSKQPPEPPVDPIPDAYMFILGDNYPNPFNNTTTIRFMLFSPMKVQLSIYNTMGQRIADLFSGNLTKGEHFIHWDGRNRNGVMMPSGLYFIRMQSGAIIQTRKMILLR